MSIGSILWTPRVAATIPNGQYNAGIREPRVGVMLHFDGSSTDPGALAWFRHPDCRVSYQDLVLDDGSYGVIAPPTARAWHAGACRPSSDRLRYTDANSAFFGIAAATNDRVEVTSVQLLTIARRVRAYFDLMGWPATDGWRVTGHDLEAWPRGRKSDPTGPNALNAILALNNVRMLLPLFRTDGEGAMPL